MKVVIYDDDGRMMLTADATGLDLADTADQFKLAFLLGDIIQNLHWGKGTAYEVGVKWQERPLEGSRDGLDGGSGTPGKVGEKKKGR